MNLNIKITMKINGQNDIFKYGNWINKIVICFTNSVLQTLFEQ
jgi:hypothetical protein